MTLKTLGACMHCVVPVAEVWVAVKTPTLSLVASHLAGRKFLMEQDTGKGHWPVPGCPDGPTSLMCARSAELAAPGSPLLPS